MNRTTAFASNGANGSAYDLSAIHARPGVLTVQLHGASLELRSSEADFMEYAARAVAAIGSPASRRPAILSRLEWVDGPRPRDLAAAFKTNDWKRQLDRDLYLDRNAAYWLRIDDFPDLVMKVSWSEGRLEVTGRYYYQIGKSPRWEGLRRLRYRNQRAALRARRFSTLVYYLVFHPLLWWLSRFDGWHAMHAAAVAVHGRTHVLAGLPGCGKSTLAVGALALPGAELLSDNLLLTDGESVRACPELLLLDEGSVARIGAAREHLTKVGDRRVFARDSYRAWLTRFDPLRPSMIHLVHRSQCAERNALDPAWAATRLEAGNLLAKEVRRCRIMAQVLDLVAGTRTPDERAVMMSLASSAPCFESGVPGDESPSAVFERLAEPLR